MTTEAAINALTAQTSELLETCVAIRAGVTAQISDAVAVSTNAALIPMMTVARNLVDTQVLLVTYISTR